MKIIILKKIADVRRISHEWGRIGEGHGVFQKPEFFEFCRPAINSLKYRLHVMASTDEGGGICGILPVYRRRFSRKLLFFNGEKNEILFKKGAEAENLKAFGEFLKKGGFYIYSNFIHEDSQLKSLYQYCGWKMEEWDRNYYIDLSRGFSFYLEKFGAKSLYTMRRKRKQLEQTGPCELVFSTGPADFEYHFNEFVSLNQKRWGEKAVSLKCAESVLETKRLAEFLMRTGRLFLNLFRINGKNISAYFGAMDDGMIHYMQSGWDPAYERYSPSTLHLLEILKWAVSRKISNFDFMPYSNEHKKRFSTGSNAVFRNQTISPANGMP